MNAEQIAQKLWDNVEADESSDLIKEAEDMARQFGVEPDDVMRAFLRCAEQRNETFGSSVH